MSNKIEKLEDIIVGGICVDNVEAVAKDMGIELNNEQKREILDLYRSNYMESGDGLHGHELIKYIIVDLIYA